jgi:hypothetical protein
MLSFLLISNKFCDLIKFTVVANVQGGIEMWEGRGQCGKKFTALGPGSSL